MSPAAQIEHVLSEDQRYANQLARHRENGISERQAIATYVENIFEIDLAPLPKDFRAAFHDHRQAWRQREASLSAAPGADPSSLMNVGQAVARVAGSDGLDLGAWMDLISEFESSEGSRGENKIGKTWEKVQDLAVRYGATIEVEPYRYPDESLVTLTEVRAEEARWDPEIGGVAAPDMNLTLSVDGTEICSFEGKDDYIIRPGCTFLIRPSSKVRVNMIDDDLDEPDPIGTWEGSGKELLSSGARSFDQVQSFTIEEE